jgi:hypothetical protein
MNNKPVLWTDGDGNYYHQNIGYYTIPLYTHPVKELTDEEIKDCIMDLPWNPNFSHLIGFARAILRKAQEK